MPTTPLKRRISALVLLTFTSLTLQPLQAVAQWQLAQAKATQSIPPGDDEQVARLLAELKESAQRGADKARKGQATRDDAKLIRTLKRQLEALEPKIDASFAATEADLIAKRLPAEILTRHRTAVQDYKAKQTEFKRHTQALETADDQDNDPARASGLTSLSTWLEQNQKGTPHTKTDPHKLPFRTPESKVRAPIESEAGFKSKQTLFGHKRVHLAGPIPAGGIAFPQALDPQAPPTAADLNETEDIQLTPAIRAQAAALNNHPVQIHNWVRNNIEYLPTYGSIQGSDLTLQTKRGNAFDTASLEIALLRAAGIPARYVYGAIQVPVAQAMNWVGGVTKPEAALNLMGQGGIPSIGLLTGGQISHIKMEHVWVEAYVDYVPSRGAVNKTPDTWVPLDGSYKQYQYSQGMDIKANVPIDAQKLLTQAQAGATVNQTEGWVQNLNQANLQSALTGYQTQVKSYIDSQKPNATVGDVLGSKTVQQKHHSILMGTLPYQTLAVGSRMTGLPDGLRHKFRFDLYASEYDKSMGSPTFSLSQSLPTLAGKKVTLVYEAASPADQAVIDNAYNTYQTSLPAYLIHVKPVLKIEGVTTASGPTMTMGEKQVLTVTASTPWYGQERDYKVTAGDLSVLGINPAGVTAEAFTARTTLHDLSKGNDPDFTAEMFNQIMLGWWGEKYAFNDIIGATNRVIHYQLPSHGMAGAPLTVRYFFGFARSANYQSRILDAKEDLVIAEHADGDPEQRRRFMLALGQVGSYLEAGIYDQAFLMEPGHSMSTITALKAANDQGIPIYTIDQSNISTALSRISTDADTIADIQNAVAAGMRVTAAQRDITVDNFTGMGYILEDPVTGAAAYLVSGGRNGNNSPTGGFFYPLPQVPATSIISIMTKSARRDAGMTLVASQGGMILGVALPAASGGNGGGALAGLAAVLMVVSHYMSEIDKKYPKKNAPYRLRKYSTSFGATRNAVTQSIRQSMGDQLSYGIGVYLALQNDSTLLNKLGNVSVHCPPTSTEADAIAAAYELPNAQTPPDPSMAAAYVDISITRDGYYVIEEIPNPKGVTEVVVREPLLPVFEAGGQYQYLYFGPYSMFVEFDRLCI